MRKMTPKSMIERFLMKVDFSGSCWEWRGSKDLHGYGKFKLVDERRPREVHRVMWERAIGPIPEGLCVLHRCDNPACLRPSHLFLGTMADNTADMMAKGRMPIGDANPCTVISDESVRKIRMLYAAGGITQSQLGQQFGINQTTVSQIIRRKKRRYA